MCIRDRYRSYPDSLTEKQKNNLCGYYVCIKRSSVDINSSDANTRKIIVSNLIIYKDHENLIFRTYDYHVDDSAKLISGYVVRDSKYSVRLIADLDCGINFFLSVPDVKIENEGGIFINGNYMAKNQHNKPYSTWSVSYTHLTLPTICSV